MIPIFVKATGIWLVIVVAAILNGFVREKILTPILGAQFSLPLSGITLSVLIFVITYFLVPFIGRYRGQVFLLTGLLWVALTLSFEYSFGYFVLEKSLSEISTVFNITEGNLFVLTVICSAVAPWLTAKVRGIF